MKDFNMQFVELCANEPALYDPRHFNDRGSAAGRISGALAQKGFAFGPEEVQPTFDQLRGLYGMELENRIKGRCSELNWFHEMDAYMRPFVRSWPDSFSCSKGEPGASTATRKIKIEEVATIEDDTPCDVCRETMPEDDNEMVFCSGCDVCVHQACYGVPVVPEGDWFCLPCQLRKKPACALCPKAGGAMKCTRDGYQWAHVSCTWWIKEAKFDDPERVADINISNIPNRRWNLVCSLCRNKYGACIQCTESNCAVAYHVTCAYDRGLKMNMCDDPGKDGVKLMSYCKKHTSAINTPKSKRKRKQKKKTRRRSQDVENYNTAAQKLPLRYLSEIPQTSTSETVTSDGSLYEISDFDESITSDDNNFSCGMDSSTTQSSGTGGWLSSTDISMLLNGDKNGSTTYLNTQTTAIPPPEAAFEGCPNETVRDGKHFCKYSVRTSCNEEPPAKRVRFSESRSEQSSSMQNKSSADRIPVTATHKTEISFENSDTSMEDMSRRTSFSVKISSEEQSKPEQSFPAHSNGIERDHRPSIFKDKSTSIQTKHCSPCKNQPFASPDLNSQSVRDQPSDSSCHQKETIENSSAEEHSGNENYEQFAKFIAVHLKSLSPEKAKRLERKIICLCWKNRRTKENASKVNPA